jgi:uncharacterized protein (TIGR03437 family)
MLHRVYLCLALSLTLRLGLAHGIPTPVPNGPLHIQRNVIVDSTGQMIPLRGVEMPGLNLANPTAGQRQTVDAINAVTFGILRLRWNVNTVRLPVSNWVWRREGQTYLDRVGKIVQAANDAGLVVVISDYEDSSAGAPTAINLPLAESISFWQTWAAYFKNYPHVILGVFNGPSVDMVPGHVSNQRTSTDWQFWLKGGTALNGQTVVGMQALVDAIRSTGASHVVAVSAFSDPLDFQDFGPDFFVKDANAIYEIQPFFNHALTDADRDRNFGFLAPSVPLYAGRWGVDLTNDGPGCRSVPRDPQAATDLLFQTLAYFDRRAISWTTSSYEPRSLVQDLSSYDPTRLDRTWTCGIVTDPEPGMGQVQLLWLTGDPTGFGVIAADQTASAAGGPALPVAPGELINFFGFLFGPQNNTVAAFDDFGKLPTALDSVRVLFDGEAAPIVSTGPYLITVQVPYSVQGKNHVAVQLFYGVIPSNTIQLSVLESAPGIVTALGTNEALALNQDGTRNSISNPASPGSIVLLFATGYGQTSPPGVSGQMARAPCAQPALLAAVMIDRTPTDILYAAEAPGFVGLLQINARIPDLPSAPKARALPVVLNVGSQSSISGVTLWVQ